MLGPPNPTAENIKPIPTATSPLATLEEMANTSVTSPNVPIQKVSAGPKLSNTGTNTGRNKMSTKTPNTAPKPEAQAETLSANTGFPCCVRG